MRKKLANEVDGTDSYDKPDPDSGTMQRCSQALLVLFSCYNVFGNLLPTSLNKARGNLLLLAAHLNQRTHCNEQN